MCRVGWWWWWRRPGLLVFPVGRASERAKERAGGRVWLVNLQRALQVTGRYSQVPWLIPSSTVSDDSTHILGGPSCCFFLLFICSRQSWTRYYHFFLLVLLFYNVSVRRRPKWTHKSGCCVSISSTVKVWLTFEELCIEQWLEPWTVKSDGTGQVLSYVIWKPNESVKRFFFLRKETGSKYFNSSKLCVCVYIYIYTDLKKKKPSPPPLPCTNRLATTPPYPPTSLVVASIRQESEAPEGCDGKRNRAKSISSTFYITIYCVCINIHGESSSGPLDSDLVLCALTGKKRQEGKKKS